MFGSLLERGVGYYLEYEEVMQDIEDVDGPLWTGNVNPGHVIGFSLGAAYVAWPLDFIPDYIPVIGYVDDALILNASTTIGGYVWDLFDQVFDVECDRCGYHPRKTDAQHVVLDKGLDELEETILYVRCYQCGHEWVE